MTKDEFMKKYNSRIFYGDSSIYNPLALYGITCNDGWLNIIYTCAEELCKIDLEERVKFLQIKEKFGGLRFYYTILDYNKEFDYLLYIMCKNIVSKAELLANETCEYCGERGTKKIIKGTMITACPICAANKS